MTDGEDVLSLTEQLIAIESHADAPGREAEIGRFLVGWFRDRGIDAELQPVDELIGVTSLYRGIALVLQQ